MRLFICAAVVLSFAQFSGFSMAQDQPQGDQLKKMYDETLAQLKAAQERKNELSAENEKLNAKVAEMQKQLDAAKAQTDNLQRELDKSFLLRANAAAWERFLNNHPELSSKWRVFLRASLFEAPEWLVK